MTIITDKVQVKDGADYSFVSGKIPFAITCSSTLQHGGYNLIELDLVLKNENSPAENQGLQNDLHGGKLTLCRIHRPNDSLCAEWSFQRNRTNAVKRFGECSSQITWQLTF